MSDRRPYVGGNWKMNLHRDDAVALAETLAKGWTGGVQADAVVFPAFPYLSDVGRVIRDAGSALKLGAQDFYPQPDGAFTGEVSLAMLRDVGVTVVLVGHSERRHVIGETDELINQKVRAALDADFEVILCVGETLDQREQKRTDGINAAQTRYGLAGVKPAQLARVTIAYEPVWAIGTGKTATPQDAQSAHSAIRQTLEASIGSAAAAAMRIQYGGSVKSGNAAQLFAQPDIDGGLIGGASLKADEFLAILHAAASPVAVA